jgi:hypothetical protein
MSHTRVAGGAYTFNWNGSSLFTGATSSGNNLTGLAINTGTWPAETSACQIAEILVYSNVLSFSQVQQVEGYLAWKWGLTSGLPTSHPFKAFPPAMRIFHPYDITPAPEFWFDAADCNTIVATGTTLSTLSNKGTTTGSNATVTAGTVTTGSVSRQNGLNVIGLGVGTGTLTASMAFPTQARTRFFAARPNTNQGAGGAANDVYFLDQGFATGTDRIVLDSANNGGRPVEVSSFVVITMITTNQLANQSNVFGTYTFRNATSAAARNRVAYNGSNMALTTSAVASGYATTAITTKVGSNTDVGEWLSYNTELTDAQVAQMEGYLAWKWGLQRSLPTTHSYYTVTPSTALFVPTSISNCAIWLDAADTSTITGTTTVTAWTNKGTLGGTASNFTGSCTSGNTFNGLNYINSPAGTEMRITATLATQARSWFVVTRINTVLGSGNFVGLMNAASSTQDNLVVTYSNATTNLIFMGPNGIAVTLSGNVPAATSATVHIASLVNSATSTASNIVTINGSSVTLANNALASGFGTGSYAYRIGTSSYNTSVDFMEIIFYYGSVTPTERQRVEGYLAWKWGLRTSLPTTHPYYKFRP